MRRIPEEDGRRNLLLFCKLQLQLQENPRSARIVERAHQIDPRANLLRPQPEITGELHNGARAVEEVLTERKADEEGETIRTTTKTTLRESSHAWKKLNYTPLALGATKLRSR